jgi:hypothetical protein
MAPHRACLGGRQVNLEPRQYRNRLSQRPDGTLQRCR